MHIRIYKEKKSPVQSSKPQGKWILEAVPNVQNSYYSSCMHWNASQDSTKQIKIKFDSYEEAAKYAQSQGMRITSYVEDDMATKKMKKNSYLDNF